MKTRWTYLTALFLAVDLWAGTVPSQITYQGTLKQGSSAANGAFTMTFRLTDSEGLTQYWSSGPMPVTVSQGLFSAVLAPTGVDWQNVTPYMEANVNGQVLLPREPVTSAAYAQMCGAVANESGMIAMFAGNCPSGWIRFTALDGLFPMGGATYGETGGSAAHFHTLTKLQNIGNAQGASAVGVIPGTTGLASFIGGGITVIEQMNNYTDDKSHLPPYLKVVFCQKP